MFIEPKQSLKVLSEAILQLSNYFIAQPEASTPWHESYCMLAYRHYYLPLNFLRNELVIRRGQKIGFFKGLDTTVDWGAGPGTASLALARHLRLKKQVIIEKSPAALDNFKDLFAALEEPVFSHDKSLKNVGADVQRSLLVFSYSLTEMDQLPAGWNNYEALMILEPSTRDDGRKLLAIRAKLIENGYTLWAPCLHQRACPLLIHSKNDWCHDRVHVEAPEWFLKLEDYLPFRNRTITTSYLLARKSNRPTVEPDLARVTGDSLDEKGKTRQLVCRGDAREFLTWMHKDIKPQIIPRGELIELPPDAQPKSNELRIQNGAVKII